MSLRDRQVRRNSHNMSQIAPAQVRPQSAMEAYIGMQQEEKFDSPRAKRLYERALRVESRYDRRKGK